MKNKEKAKESHENEKEKGKAKRETAKPTWNFGWAQYGPGKSNMATRGTSMSTWGPYGQRLVDIMMERKLRRSKIFCDSVIFFKNRSTSVTDEDLPTGKTPPYL